MPRYKVVVDDNFHYQDLNECREQGVYETVEEALAVCRGLVDKSLKEEYRSGISAESLYDRYTSFGDDPFIVDMNGRTEHSERTCAQSSKNAPPTPAAMSGAAATTNEPRHQPRRYSTQPRAAPITNQSGIDRTAKDPTQTHSFCSLLGASKAITAVIKAIGAVPAAQAAQATVSTMSMVR
jgi:hypothetical protein